MDFKSSFFDTVRLRNELMARLGQYLLIPSQLDTLTTKNDLMLKSVVPAVKANAVVLKSRIDTLRAQTEARITSTQKLSNDILTLKDTVEADPSLKKLLTGETGFTTFAIDALVSNTATNYKPYLDKSIEYSKAALATIKDLETIQTALKSLTKNVEATYAAAQGRGAVPSLAEAASAAEAEVFGLPIPVAVVAVVSLFGMLVLVIRRKK